MDAQDARPLVVSFGAGVDSTAMLVEMKNRGIRPDLIIFADTRAERPATYIHIERMKAWLRRVGFPELVTVKYDPPIAPYKDLEGNCLSNQTLPSLAFGMKSCSVKWKVKPQEKFIDRWMEERGMKGGRRRHAIGLDNSPADIRRRKTYAGGTKNSPRCDYWYPLQDWDIDRERAMQIIAAEGIEVPMKSCCFFCPGMKKDEIRDQAEAYPELHERALELEANYRAGRHFRPTGVQGLGRKFAWGDVEVKFPIRGKVSDAA